MSSVFKPLCVLAISRGKTLPERLEQVLRNGSVVHEIQHVRGFLLALGALGADMAEHLPDLIVGDATLLRADIESNIEALRELAPSSRIVLIADEEQSTDLSELPSRLDVTIARASDDDEKLLATLIESRSAGGSDTAADREHSVDWEVRPHLPPNDTHMLREIMNPHGDVGELAVTRVLEQCNVPGIAYTTNEPKPSQTATPVFFGGQQFGFLVADDETSSDSPIETEGNANDSDNDETDMAKLQLWADWLAHWLALQQQSKDLWRMSMRDELTGAWNRRYFSRFLKRIVQHATDHRTSVTLMIFDIDDFKSYNDKYGHAAGDEILIETARMMQATVRDQDIVARIGGDEFGVIFWDAEAPRRAGSRHPVDVRNICERFKKMILSHKFPKLLHEAPGTLTISAGLAGFPWDAKTPDELFERADAMALAGKREGKNAIKFGPGLIKNGHGNQSSNEAKNDPEIERETE